MKKILIATDGSASANQAVGVGVELAAEQDAQVTFIHVLPPDDYIVAGRLGPVLPKPHEVAMDETEVALREAAEAAEAAGVVHAQERVSGDTVDEIVAAADSMQADVIVIGSRGRGPISSALLGSVSQGVLSESRRPVLIVSTIHDREPVRT